MSGGFMPQKVFAASEGTLGIVTSAKLRILDIPAYRCMMVLGFKDLIGAVSAAQTILKFSPVALEMLDHTVISRSGRRGDAGCLLFVEFAGGSRKIEDRLKECRQELAGRCSVLEYASDEQSMARIWRARTGALNEIMKLTVGSRRPIGLIEDTVVRPELLAAHAANLLKTYQENNLDYVMYGHVGDGNMHTRPLVDTGSGEEVELIQRIAGRIFEQVIRSGGTITGEHGDGLARVGYIEMMYGRQLASLFSDVKRQLDPDFMLNPGKKVPVQSFKNGPG
jgi:FAD/FMN-containing dehydrogenase